MKSLNRAFERFCHNHTRFGLPNLMLYLIIGNAAMYLLNRMDTTGLLMQFLVFSPSLIFKGQLWRLFTFLFLPSSDNILFFAISLYFYYFIGNTLESQWGTAKFSCYYLFSFLTTLIFGFVMYAIGKPVFLTATYMNLSLFFAFAILFPETRVLLFFFIPIKIKWLALVSLAFYLYEIIVTSFPANLLPIIALLSCAVFCWSELSQILGWTRAVASPGRVKHAIQLKVAAKQVRNEQSQRGYRHKCEVCGRTDTENPGLEFRYCSRCEGYHCFCLDHINCHEHFKS